MRRKAYNRSAPDGASERAVTAQVELWLCCENVCQPQHVAAWPDQMQRRVRGYYLKTQQTMRRTLDRQAFAASQTQSRGIPDLLVRLAHWPAYVWVGVELKNRRGTGRPTAEQQLLAEARAVLICDDAGTLWRAIMAADAALRGTNGQS